MAETTHDLASEHGAPPAFLARLKARRIPSASIAHYLGGVVLFLFVLQVASGILLLLPYRPDPAQAHESIIAITGRVPYGALVRGVHAWTSHLFVAFVMAHLATIVVTGRYRAPRQWVWVTGTVLLAMGFTLAFTGAILPWSQSAYLQARVSSEMVGHAPILGPWLKELLRGGEDVNAWTLHHAFGTHTGVLPAVTTMVMAIHIGLVQRNPWPVYDSDLGVKTIPAYPDFLVRLAAVCTGILVVIISLATFAAVPVGAPVELQAFSAADASPPWYFLFLHQALRASPATLIGIASDKVIGGVATLLGVAAFALPFLDRKGSKVTVVVAGVLFVIWLLLTIYALL